MRAFRLLEAWTGFAATGGRRRWTRSLWGAAVWAVVISGCGDAMAQSAEAPVAGPGMSAAALTADAKQMARLLDLDTLLAEVSAMRAARPCEAAATMKELTEREDLVESIQAASLDADSVLADLGNEQSELTEMRAELQSRRDKSVARLNTAALLTGSGLSAVVSATQFTTLGSKAQNTGDAVGVGAGAASTILSLLAAKRQSGPSATIRNTPDMLAPLLDGAPKLPGRYPLAVLRYLHAAPGEGGAGRPTRLDLLHEEWARAGRLSAGRGASQFAVLTSSNDPAVRATISDVSNRIAMLGDVRGRVSLMKRDLSTLRRASLGPAPCAR